MAIVLLFLTILVAVVGGFGVMGAINMYRRLGALERKVEYITEDQVDRLLLG